MLTPGQTKAAYTWPSDPLDGVAGWARGADDGARWRSMPELAAEVAKDSRWPAFFPSPIALVTTGDETEPALEKVVGASIVNRFPYLIALSFCRETLSERHYARSRFCEVLEQSGGAAVQFIAPGPAQEAAMAAIATEPDSSTTLRVKQSGLEVRSGISVDAPVFEESFMVYEARLVKPSVDLEGRQLFERPWADVGSHRIYFLEITTIQLAEDIADGRRQVAWRSLPAFSSDDAGREPLPRPALEGYVKDYRPNYRFPAAGTIAFHRDYVQSGMAVLHPKEGLVLDNDEARWPCFFPQSAGIITSRSPDGRDNVMPCGSTTVVSRHPLVISPCVSYAAVNERYAPRASLDMILDSGWFGCGVPYIDDGVVDAIRYAGNTSLRKDLDKLSHSGFRFERGDRVPVLTGLPIFYECKVVGVEYLGTHAMIFGEVQRIRVSDDVSRDNPLEWCPWPDVV